MSKSNWLNQWIRFHQTDSEWGFVVFRTALYDDEIEWKRYKNQIQRIIDVTFETAAKHGDDAFEQFEIARDRFRLEWIEGPDLAGANAVSLRRKYHDLMPSLPTGLQNQAVFLCASPIAVSSVQSLPEAEFPTVESKLWRKNAPFLLAVDVNVVPDLDDQDEEDDSYGRIKPVFKVALETIAHAFWETVDSDARPLWHSTLSIKADEELELAVAVLKNDNPNLEQMWWSSSPSPARMSRRRPWLADM